MEGVEGWKLIQGEVRGICGVDGRPQTSRPGQGGVRRRWGRKVQQLRQEVSGASYPS